MKFNPNGSSSRRKSRKAHFTAPSHIRRKIMSASLSKDLRAKHGIRSLPIRKGDEVQIVRGNMGNPPREGKVTEVYRKKFIIHVERATFEKQHTGALIEVPIHPSNCVITKIKMDKDRKDLIARKSKKTEKYSEGDVSNMAGVD